MTPRDPRLQPAPRDQVLTADGKSLTVISRDGDTLIVGTRTGKELPGISLQTWKLWCVGGLVMSHADLDGHGNAPTAQSCAAPVDFQGGVRLGGQPEKRGT